MTETIPADNSEMISEGKRYRDLAQRIRNDILSGKLQPGNRLPSIRDCAQIENLSPGTVKHAYSLLENEGLIEMIQGRGSLIKAIRKNSDSRNSTQVQAMELIDKTIDSLLTLGFSLRIISIFMDLKLKARNESASTVRVAVTDRCPEIRRMIIRELLRIQEVDLIDFDSSEIISNLSLVHESADLVISSSDWTGDQPSSFHESKEVLHLALTPSPGTIIRLVQHPANSKVVLLSNSREFAQIMQATISRFCGRCETTGEFIFGKNNLQEILKDKKPAVTLVVPHDYELFCSQNELTLLNAFADHGGAILKFKLVLDQGSNLFLDNKLQSIRRRKQLEKNG